MLAERSDQVVSLIANTNALLAELQSQSACAGPDLGQHLGAVSQQLQGFIAENRATIEAGAGQAQRRADHRRQPQGAGAEVDQAAQRPTRCRWVSRWPSGPFFKAYIANLLPGQFVQPFIDAAFSDLGLDPNVLLPSQRTDPQIGQPGTPALPVPYPRTGQGGEPHLTLPDAITGNPGDPRYGPYRDAAARPPAATRTGAAARRRPAARRRDRRPSRRPASRPPRCRPCARSAAGAWPGPAVTRPWAAARPRGRRCGGRPMTLSRDTRLGVAVVLVLTLLAGVAVLMRSGGPIEPDQRRRLLRQQQRHLRRRRRAHPRCAGRQDRQDRTGAAAGQDHVLVRRQVQGARRRQGRHPVAGAGDRPRHPAHPGLHRRTGHGGRRRHPAGAHRGAGGVGRLPRAAASGSTETLQPTEPGGVSTLGALVNTTADNLRGQGANIRDTIIKLSQAFSALGDHSTDIFGTVKNLSILVSALQDSTDLMRQLNQNLADVTGLLADDPDEVGYGGQRSQRRRRRRPDASSPTTARPWAPRRTSWPAITHGAQRQPRRHQADCCTSRRTRCRTSSTSTSRPRARSPARWRSTTSRTRSRSSAARFRRRRGWAPSSRRSCACSTWRRSSRTGSTTSCRSGRTSFVGAQARPNEVTYSEDWMRPDYVPPGGPNPMAAPPRRPDAGRPRRCPRRLRRPSPMAAEATNPADGLPG